MEQLSKLKEEAAGHGQPNALQMVGNEEVEGHLPPLLGKVSPKNFFKAPAADCY